MKMKICMVATDFPYREREGTITQGGGGACAAQLVGALVKKGVSVSVITRAEENSKGEIFRIPVYRTGFAYLGFRESKITHSIFALPTAFLVFSRERFDVLHSHNPPAALTATIISKLFRTPQLLTMHGPWAGVRMNPLTRLLGRLIEGLCVHLADRVTCDSRALIEEMARIYKVKSGKLAYIPNAVDVSIFKPLDKKKAREKLNLETGGKIILYTGRFVREKGLPFLLDASEEIFRRNPGSRILLVGGGFDEHIVKNWIEKNPKFAKSIRVLPYARYELMPHVYSACDVFVLPSLAEGMSRSVMEAMACGLPVVATRVGGNPELVQKDTGILVEPENPAQLSGAVCELLGNEKKSKLFGKRAREFIAKNMSVEHRVGAFLKIYAEMTKNDEKR
ncbi:MAG: glycosyltransferase family 4 protein [Candidatus Micrarchaeota archaeon]